ncbi:tetratricopeptide repeat protein [Stieleria varia]|uniref:Tetratricopeptide repeat protein n=1 Tax=Stieleria varia TaxID=2528005 RepID=A0A5C6A4X5_9BACT|nr:tetratricopeptide repeat protein [Stieleria varia]TWT94435.1 Tetratricopeptide repeat protein [Stieleria varia]
MPRIFISGTTRDLKSFREVVAQWANEHGHEPVVQDDFPVQSDYNTVVQMLRDKLAPCDAVIHLVGLFYGFEPTNRPDGELRRSYTQLEYELGRELRRQVFRFIARQDYVPDNHFSQTDEQAELQRLHRQRLMEGNEAWSATSRTTGNELYYEFSNHDELRKLLDKIEIKSTLAKPQNLPIVGSLFKGRDEFIKQLRSVLVDKPTHIAAVTAKQAIHGLGGIGKTRVALEYAKRYSHEYTALLFITADSPANLQRNLANLCGALVLNLPEKDAIEQEVQVAAALRWLREHSGWFLIVDNVDTPDVAVEVESLLQKLDSGHVVVTSRLSQWGDAVQELSLDVISEPAAQDFLLERTAGKRKSTPADEADALTLANLLGRLPLALEQAGAFIVKHHTGFRTYLDRWKQLEAKVLQWHDQRTMKYPASVATTWQTSFDRLTDDGRGLLNVLCWLAPDPIPLTMIEKVSSTDNEQPIDVETGIADLAEYSLLKWTDDQYHSVEVHRLVEEITRYRLPEPDRVAWLQRALRMVNDFVPAEPTCYDVRSWPTIYIPGQSHIAAVVQFADQMSGKALAAGSTPSVRLALTPRLMSCLAGYLKTRAAHQEAEPLTARVVNIFEQTYGEDHPSVAAALNNLAALFQATNRLAEAEPLMRRALAIDEQSYGAEHPDVAIDLNNLAALLQETNRPAEAEPLMRRALAIDEQSLGAEHSNVAIRLNNLAALLQETNRPAEAEQLYRRALAIDEQTYGAEHPDVARDLNNLAALLQAANRPAEAEQLYRRALAIDEQSFGAEHPRVATDLNNLAALLQATNRLAEAEPLMRRALAIDQQSYGARHPDVARDLNNLATLLQDTNRLAEAEPLMRRAVEIFQQSLGDQHPKTVTVRRNHALIVSVMDDQ